jgi:N-acetyl-gamma-glutamyl-phosphate reductase
LRAYQALKHPHEAELKEKLQQIIPNTLLHINFIPHLIPTSRGIFIHIFIPNLDIKEDIYSYYKEFYKESYFVRIRDNLEAVRINYILFTNFCDIAILPRNNGLILVAALDNLGKGGASQAIQAMNLRFNLPEICGIS